MITVKVGNFIDINTFLTKVLRLGQIAYLYYKCIIYPKIEECFEGGLLPNLVDRFIQTI